MLNQIRQLYGCIYGIVIQSAHMGYQPLEKTKLLNINRAHPRNLKRLSAEVPDMNRVR